MGFSSWECNGCGHPLLSEYVTNEVNAWMSQAVIIATPDHRNIYPDDPFGYKIMGDGVLMGTYDGYARIETRESWAWSRWWCHSNRRQKSEWDDGVMVIDILGWSIQHEWGREEVEPCVWHRACWNKAGQPTDHQPSTPAMDQGYFFNQTTDHQMEEPDGK
tara:strand:+ start:2090 stop:2572 length:483 start_codon:yes stop_codon:yes gene_type:complete